MLSQVLILIFEAVYRFGLESLFDSAQKSLDTVVNDIFTLSSDFSNLRNFAKDFSQSGDISNLNTLGSAMYERGILNKEEKMGFDVLYKINPSLDSAQTQNLLQNTNLHPVKLYSITGDSSKLISNKSFTIPGIPSL